MNIIKQVLMAIAITFSSSLSAQDFGYPQDKAFYKAHWNDIVKDLRDEYYLENMMYMLYDFDKDNRAELFLWTEERIRFLYAIKGGKAVRVCDSQKDDPKYNFYSFYPYFLAPVQYLLDKKLPDGVQTEQQLYDKYSIVPAWYRTHPRVTGTFNIKTLAANLLEFDCFKIGDALQDIANGRKDESTMSEFTVDVKNGYACIRYNTPYFNTVELCYWNLTNGEKLVALAYEISDETETDVESFTHILFMKYNPKTKQLNPIAAPIQGFDFFKSYRFNLPQQGKNIQLSADDGEDDHTLQWTGNGFKY